MSFTYDATQLEHSPHMQVRFKLGDVRESSAHFQDEEIQFMLKQNGNDITRTCISLVEALLPQLASYNSFTVGPYSEDSGSHAYEYWTKMLDELKASLVGYSAPVAHLPQKPTYFYLGMMGTEESSATD